MDTIIKLLTIALFVLLYLFMSDISYRVTLLEYDKQTDAQCQQGRLSEEVENGER